MLNHKNESNSLYYNNSSIKSRANSTLYTMSKDDFENSNKYKQHKI